MKRYHRMVCEATGKQRLRDEQEAKRSLQRSRNARDRGVTRRQEVRYYPCEDCNGFHTTSQE